MEGVGCETKTSRHNRGERSRVVGPEAGAPVVSPTAQPPASCWHECKQQRGEV